MATDFRQVDLFGGAMVAELPTTFADVSEIRQVPDNQEVYLDTEGFTSIVVDILERVEKPDEEALKVHLKDIAEGDGDTEQDFKLWTTNEAVFSKLPNPTSAYTLFATAPPGQKQRGRNNEPDFVGIMLCIIRLVEQKTDIVISVNVPHIPGQYLKDEVDPQSGKHGKLLEQAQGYRQKLLETFEIKDWTLFVQD